MVEEFDAPKIQDLMDRMTKPENILILLRSRSFEGHTDREVPHYKTKYQVTDLPEDLLSKLENPVADQSSKKFGMPPPNNLIPTDFAIHEQDVGFSTTPILVKRWPRVADLWYKKDDLFKKPKVYIVANIYTKDLLFSFKPSTQTFV